MKYRDLLDDLDAGRCPGSQADYTNILHRHVQRIDERIEHLLGLRGQIEALIDRQRGRRAQTYTPERCRCLEPVKTSATAVP